VEGVDRPSEAAPDAAAPLDELQTLLWARLDELYAEAVYASESSQALQAQAAHQAQRSRELFRQARETLAEIRRRRDARRT
jgi:hypothetical protein